MCATKPSMSWPHSPSRTSSSDWALLGIRSSPRHGLAPGTSSGRLAWGVIAIGRVCGTAIGTEPIDDDPGDAEPLQDLADRAGEGLPAVVRLRAVQQQVRRAAAVVEQPDDQPRRVVGLVVVAHERHRRPAGPVVVELVDVEGRDDRPRRRTRPVSRSARCRAACAAALPASRNPSRTSTIVRSETPASSGTSSTMCTSRSLGTRPVSQTGGDVRVSACAGHPRPAGSTAARGRPRSSGSAAGRGQSVRLRRPWIAAIRPAACSRTALDPGWPPTGAARANVSSSSLPARAAAGGC